MEVGPRSGAAEPRRAAPKTSRPPQRKRVAAARYPAGVARTDTDLVNLVREFIEAFELLHEVIDHAAGGELRWEVVQNLVGEDESSLLYRLKERSHQLNRGPDGADDLSRAALFDLAVGSLFHETMKLRENMYQLAVYAPRVKRARSSAAPGTERLFEEFSRILSAARSRLAETVEETRALLEQTRVQFREFLVDCRHNGPVARYLVENADRCERVLGEPLDTFFAGVHGHAARGYELVARSYLESGFFDEALEALREALARDPSRAALRHDEAYAEGMSAYTRGCYEQALDRLEDWAREDFGVADTDFAELARVALERLPDLLPDPSSAPIGRRATALAEKLAAATP